ncbi:MAG: hypothetical protein D6812_04860, partial [Deltaproteobacteria bacterium]
MADPLGCKIEGREERRTMMGRSAGRTLLAFVGSRPAEILVALRSWRAAGGRCDRLVLFSSPERERSAQRVCEVLRRRGWRPRIARVEKVSEAGIAPFFAALPEGERLILLGGAGGAPRLLRPDLSRLWGGEILHLDGRGKLWISRVRGGEERWRSFPAKDIGLSTLLALHGITVSSRKRWPRGILRRMLRRVGRRLAPRVVRWPRFRSSNGSIIDAFALAFERWGGLYLLAVVEEEGRQERRDRLQWLLSLRDRGFEALRPTLAILSPYESIRLDAEWMGCLSIDPDDPGGWRRFERWIGGEPALAGGEEGLVRLSEPWAPVTRIEGGGGRGRKVLVTAIDSDPSAMLLALGTHAPQRAILFYDATDARGVEAIFRLRQRIAEFPVGECSFLPTDRKGRGIHERLANEIGSNVEIDVTSGTNAQKLALARMAWLRGWPIWALHFERGVAVALLDSMEVGASREGELPIRSPGLGLQAFLLGGAMKEGGDLRLPEEDVAGLRLLGEWLLASIREGHPHIPWGDLHRLRHGGSLAPDGTISFRGRRERISQTLVGGYWLEALAAQAFLDAGVDEIMRGVTFLDEERSRFVVEIDLIVRWGFRFLAVSCKAGQGGMAQARHEIETMAAHRLGTLALPILVRPRLGGQVQERLLEGGDGALLIDLPTLLDRSRLRRWVEVAFRKRNLFPFCC